MGALHIERKRVLGPNGGRHSLVWGWDWQLRPSLQEAAPPPLGLTTRSCFPRSYPSGRPRAPQPRGWAGQPGELPLQNGAPVPQSWLQEELVQSQCVREQLLPDRASQGHRQPAINSIKAGDKGQAARCFQQWLLAWLRTPHPGTWGRREAAAGTDSGPHVLGCGCWCCSLPGNGQGQSGKGRQEGLRGASSPFPEAALMPWWVSGCQGG